MEKSQKYPDVTLLTPEGTVMDVYAKRYLELGSRFYGLCKHDLKNYQNAIFMALELYQLKKEEKYLSMVEEASQKSLEHIELIKEIEPFIYSGGGIGFYSLYGNVEHVRSKYPNIEIRIDGDDVCVFADAAFPKLFDLMFQTTVRPGIKHKLILTPFEFQEDGLNKCSVRIEIHGFSYPGKALESILNGDADTITGDTLSMAFYISKMIHCRYSGNLKLIESTNEKTVMEGTFMSADNSIFDPFTKTFE